MATTRPSPTSQDKGANKIRKAAAARVNREETPDAKRPSDDRPEDGPQDRYAAWAREIDHRYLNDERSRRWREDDGGHYDGNRAERDRYELNDRQNGWQANTQVDNRTDDRPYRDDTPYRSDWRDRQWRETAHADRPSHDWRPNDDGRNEQRNGSEYDRDRSSYGNSRFRDDDHGYRTSRHDDRDYSRYGEQNDPRQPRHYSATSERDFEDRNPSQAWRHDRDHTGRGRSR